MFDRGKTDRTLLPTELSAFTSLLSFSSRELQQINKLLLHNKVDRVTPHMVDEKECVLIALSRAWIEADVRLFEYQRSHRLWQVKLYWCLVSAVLPLAAIMSLLLLRADQYTGLSLISFTCVCFLTAFMWVLFHLLYSHYDVQQAKSIKRQLGIRIAEETGLNFTPRAIFWPHSTRKDLVLVEWSDGQFSASGAYSKYLDTIMPYETLYFGQYLLYVWAIKMFSGERLAMNTLMRDEGFESNDLDFGKFDFPLLPK